MTADELLKMYVGHTQGDLGKSAEDLISEYTLPNGEIDVESLARDFHSTKRNVAALARDYALPTVHRNMASLAREYSFAGGKRNIAALARDRMLPNSGNKRNIGSLGRIYIQPSLNGKRHIATLARDFAFPQQGKRYLGALMRSGGFPYVYQKRGIASLARNGMLNYNNYVKRNVGTLARDWSLPQTRHGRSLNDQDFDGAHVDIDLQRLDQLKNNDADNKVRQESRQSTSTFEDELVDTKNKSRAKRQIDYSEEYPLPVMQNTNVFDYEDIIEALAGGYPNAEKRFMGEFYFINDYQIFLEYISLLY